MVYLLFLLLVLFIDKSHSSNIVSHYLNFKDVVSTLNDEIKEKQLVNFDYNQYKKKMISYIEMNDFDESQIKYVIDSIKKAKHIIFYGNTSEIMCLQELQFYLFFQGCYFQGNIRKYHYLL